jgi:arylformamidase
MYSPLELPVTPARPPPLARQTAAHLTARCYHRPPINTVVIRTIRPDGSKMLTYKGYKTPAEFDAGYANNIDAAVVAHWEAFFRERSRALSAPRLELAYGADERNEIDFFPALNAPPDAPTLIAIHGGLWFLFDKRMMHFLVPAFTAAGVHVACPNYRLAPAVGLGDIVGDCRRAIAFVHENRDATGSGTGRMYVLGHSAAGQLAAAMASTNWPEFDPRLPADMLNGFIGVSGFYDIEPFAETGFQQQTKFAIGDYKTWNPVEMIRTGMPPGLLVTGAKESGLLHEMMDGYAALLRVTAINVETVNVPGEDHFSVLARLGDAASGLHERVLAWML